ncbi:hypothetical protein AURDEDRAFT_177310 [Auricularia subglabra TFB-10046 SS5]|uniref:Uncharacterized protein n=1 Tax=Auricularia subglabra (strain TFB-10046 / SS5) TaxID=717982 RepID=J0D4F0_AURST|nr:hypothetical protein AURDEDRAFT_177310 [Auricularia subglabra TFB-10046 SS5]
MKRARTSSKGKAANPKPPKRPRRDENTPVHPPTAEKPPATSQKPRGGTTKTAASRSAGRASATAPTQNTTAGGNHQGRKGVSARSSPSPEADDGAAEQDADPASEDEQEDEEDTTPDLNVHNRDSLDFVNWWASLSTADKDAIRTVGRQSCMYVPFDKFQQVFHYGAIAEAKAAQQPAQPSAADKPAEKPAEKFTFTLADRCAWEWQQLKDSFPVIQDLLDRHETKSDCPFAQLNNFRGQRRGEDTLRFKKLVLSLRKWTPAIEPHESNDKSVRGLNHPEMAQLLLPPSEDWNDMTTQHAYLLAAKKKKLSPHVMPQLLFSQDDPQQKKHPSFCMNPFLPHMAQGLVLGPEAAVKGDHIAAGNSITHKLGITFVTLPFVSYVCCQARCSIANETAFGTSGERGFNYKVFYNQILKTLVGIEAMGPTGEDAITELMSWWQERIWGEDAGKDEQDDAEAAEDLTNTPADILAVYARHIEEYEEERARLDALDASE